MSSQPAKKKGKRERKKNENGDDKTAVWSEELTKTLLEICRDYQKIHRNDQPFSWVDISVEFKDKTGKDYPHLTVKNKFDNMKTQWRTWNDLRYNETGIGWNSVTRCVEADPAWWEKKLKENDKYKRFRKKGVIPEISELWDQVYGSIVAAGKHCVAPSMDPSAQAEIALIEGSSGQAEILLLKDAPQVEENVDADARLIEELNYEQLNSLDLDGEDNDVLDYVHGILTNAPSSGTLATKGKGKGKRSLLSSSGLPPLPLKKKRSNAALYNQQLQKMGERSDKILALIQNEIDGSAGKSDAKMTCDYEDVMAVIDELVAGKFLDEESLLWCFAVSELRNEGSRTTFMSLPKISGKMAWLKYEMHAQHARMGLK